MAYRFTTETQHLTSDQVAAAALAIVAGGAQKPKTSEPPRSRRRHR